MPTDDGDLVSGLLKKLSVIQAEVGGDPSKNKTAISKDGKVDEFMEIKSQMAKRIHDIKEVRG
jgi:hypothetical protein